jgi:hypothetical protein
VDGQCWRKRWIGRALGRYLGPISPFLVSRSTRASIVDIVKTFVSGSCPGPRSVSSAFGFILQEDNRQPPQVFAIENGSCSLACFRIALLTLLQGSQQAKTIWARPSARLVLVPLILSRLDQDRPRQAAKILIRSCLFRRLLDGKTPCPGALPLNFRRSIAREGTLLSGD